MTRIKNLVDQIDDELDSAKEYAEEALTYKAKGNGEWYTRYKSMSEQELGHASILHDRVVSEIDQLKNVMTPPEDMMQKWEHEHKAYIEKAAWVKQMLAM